MNPGRNCYGGACGKPGAPVSFLPGVMTDATPDEEREPLPYFGAAEAAAPVVY